MPLPSRMHDMVATMKQCGDTVVLAEHLAWITDLVDRYFTLLTVRCSQWTAAGCRPAPERLTRYGLRGRTLDACRRITVEEVGAPVLTLSITLVTKEPLRCRASRSGGNRLMMGRNGIGKATRLARTLRFDETLVSSTSPATKSNACTTVSLCRT